MGEPDSGLWLGIDTATGVAIGLARVGQPIAARTITEPNVQAEQVAPLVREVLDGAGRSLDDLAGIVVGLGPGPFTGLRAGIVTAQTLGFVADVPVKGVCSLDVLALQYAGSSPGDFVVAIDARRKELYWATYGADGRRKTGPVVTKPADLPAQPVIGPGAGLYPEVHRGNDRPAGPEVLDAGVLAANAERLPDMGREPLYLRRPDATVPTARKSALTHERPGRTK